MEARGDGVGRRKEDWEERGSDEEGRRPLEGGLEEGGRKEGGWNKGKGDIQGSDGIRTEAI